ncbi:MAG: P44/Msp2 family outer membrane protein [Cyanobacteria bacterium J06626_26]
MQIPQNALLAGVLLTTSPLLLQPAYAQEAATSASPKRALSEQTSPIAQFTDVPALSDRAAFERASVLGQATETPAAAKYTSSKQASLLSEFADTAELPSQTVSEQTPLLPQPTVTSTLPEESISLEQAPVLAITAAPAAPRVRASLEQEPILAQAPGQVDDSGWYVSLAPSLAFNFDVDIDSDGPVPIEVEVIPGAPTITEDVDVSLSVDAETGFGISGAVGYRWPNARAELEVVYNRNDVDGINVDAEAGIIDLDADLPLDGSIESIQVFLNGYYDIPTGSNIRPYIGAGVGISTLTANDIEADLAELGELELDDTGVSFVFQAKAGVSYDFANNASAFLGYRLYGIPGQNFNAFDADFDADTILVHSLQLGIRYQF